MKQPKHIAFKAKTLVVAIMACFSSAPHANPVGPAIVNGTASFAQQGSTLTVTNSNGAIINWQGFSIGANETTRFVQPSVTSSVLNRVVTSDPSALLGTMQSNGRVFLINPAGIMVGAGAQINVAGFVASSLNISDQDFLAGKLNFTATPNAGSVTNAGTITTPTGGSVYLVAPNVENTGTITTPGGETLLAAGQTVQLIDTSTPGVKVEITGDQNQATNLGTIVAESGRIGIAGVLVKNSGTLKASSAVSEGGRIFLRATKDTLVDGNSQISATGVKGGQIEALGNRVAVMDNAQLDASGSNGGGTVLVGGDYQGKNPDVQNAQVTYFGPQATLRADATDNGNGGKVIVWADDTTRAYGNISAKGGVNGGNGGFVEVSGKQHLQFAAQVNTSAPLGQTGTLLLDPTDINIVSGLTTPSGGFTLGTYDGGGNMSDSIGWTNIESQLASNNVVIQTSSVATGPAGNITISGSPNTASLSFTHDSWSSTYGPIAYNSSNKLSLLAQNAVNINVPFGNAGTGAIEIIAGWNGNLATPDLVANYTAGKNITFNGTSWVGIATNGALTLKAADTIRLLASTGNAGIDMNTGALTMVADSIILDASAGSTNYSSARIVTNGDQSFTIGRPGGTTSQLLLKGSNTAGVYGANAEIGRYGGSSGQNFTFLNGSDLTLLGGSGDGYAPVSQWSGECALVALCSGNGARINNKVTDNQTFNFSTGSSITLIGGGAGNNNGAELHNDMGNLTISGAPSILITGGSSGGATYFDGIKDINFDNDAGIGTKASTTTINASSISLISGGAAYGGAWIGGQTTNITTTGDLILNASAGTASGGAYNPANPLLSNFKSPVAIGNDGGTLSTINLFVGGNLTLTGGQLGLTGSSPAFIGGAFNTPANVTINTVGNVTLSSGNLHADRIGSASGGSVIITSSNGNISLGNGLVGTGTVTLAAPNGTITETTGAVLASTLAATAQSISMLGGNKATNLIATASAGNIQYNSASSFHATSLTNTASTGGISITTITAPTANIDVALGTLTAGSAGTVSVTATGAILDDNGSANNITAANASLTSYNGSSSPGLLAISTDASLTGYLSASVSPTATYGDINIRSLGTQPSSITLSSQATSQGRIDFFQNGALTLNANTAFNSSIGSVNIGASGPITLGSVSAGVVAGQTLSHRHPRRYNRDRQCLFSRRPEAGRGQSDHDGGEYTLCSLQFICRHLWQHAHQRVRHYCWQHG